MWKFWWESRSYPKQQFPGCRRHDRDDLWGLPCVRCLDLCGVSPWGLSWLGLGVDSWCILHLLKQLFLTSWGSNIIYEPVIVNFFSIMGRIIHNNTQLYKIIHNSIHSMFRKPDSPSVTCYPPSIFRIPLVPSFASSCTCSSQEGNVGAGEWQGLKATVIAHARVRPF